MTGNQHMQYEKEERRKLLHSLVTSGMSLNEMRRSYGFDHRTVLRNYPDYKAFDVGGGGEAAVVRETNRQLNEFLRRGKIGSNKDAGFTTRGRM